MGSAWAPAAEIAIAVRSAPQGAGACSDSACREQGCPYLLADMRFEQVHRLLGPLVGRSDILEAYDCNQYLQATEFQPVSRKPCFATWMAVQHGAPTMSAGRRCFRICGARVRCTERRSVVLPSDTRQYLRILFSNLLADIKSRALVTKSKPKTARTRADFRKPAPAGNQRRWVFSCQWACWPPPRLPAAGARICRQMQS